MKQNPNIEYRNTKQIRMTEIQNSKEMQKKEMGNSKQYDLEDRTFRFARDVRALIKKLHKTLENAEDGKQLIRSSGAVGANYIEANEALSKKDFLLRIKICRKEAKESRYWLNLIDTEEDSCSEEERKVLIQESSELMNIFGAILRKSE